MVRKLSLATAICLALTFSVPEAQAQEKSKADFDITASYIEACSCDMFCPCYFNTHSTMHEGKHFCKANLVFRVDKGYYKNVKLDGAKVWLTTDLGSDWSTGADSWGIITYDPKVSAEQKVALGDIIAQLYPFKWQSMKTDTAAFSWNVDEKTGVAQAKREDGKAEVILERVKGDYPNKEVVVHNLHYWNAPSNDGFRMWKSKREAYEGQGQKFEFTGTNGFLITIHFSGQAKAAPATASSM